MAGQTDNETNKYAHVDRLSTETLEELLRADIESSDDDNDEAIFHILEVIEQREKEHPTGRLSDVDKAWEDFQKYYNTPEGEGLSLYPDNKPDNSQPKIRIVNRPVTQRVRPHRIRRTLIVAAIVACLVVFAVPPALGYQNFIQMIGQWTEDVFHFGSVEALPPSNSAVENSAEHIGEYDSLQAALDDYNIVEQVVPTRIADGFEQTSVTVTEAPEFHTVDFNVFYENDAGKSISISITQRETPNTAAYEKDEDDVIPYTVGDITHYIFENHERTIATWYVGTLECSIKADLALANMEKLIDSIYER